MFPFHYFIIKVHTFILQESEKRVCVCFYADFSILLLSNKSNTCAHLSVRYNNFNRPGINFNSNGFLIDSENIFFTQNSFIAIFFQSYDEILYDAVNSEKMLCATRELFACNLNIVFYYGYNTIYLFICEPRESRLLIYKCVFVLFLLIKEGDSVLRELKYWSFIDFFLLLQFQV